MQKALSQPELARMTDGSGRALNRLRMGPEGVPRLLHNPDGSEGSVSDASMRLGSFGIADPAHSFLQRHEMQQSLLTSASLSLPFPSGPDSTFVVSNAPTGRQGGMHEASGRGGTHSGGSTVWVNAMLSFPVEIPSELRQGSVRDLTEVFRRRMPALIAEFLSAGALGAIQAEMVSSSRPSFQFHGSTVVEDAELQARRAADETPPPSAPQSAPSGTLLLRSNILPSPEAWIELANAAETYNPAFSEREVSGLLREAIGGDGGPSAQGDGENSFPLSIVRNTGALHPLFIPPSRSCSTPRAACGSQRQWSR